MIDYEVLTPEDVLVESLVVALYRAQAKLAGREDTIRRLLDENETLSRLLVQAIREQRETQRRYCELLENQPFQPH